MEKTAFITDFKIINPPYFIEQQKSFDWLEDAYEKANHSPERTRKLISKVACPPAQVSKRGHYLEDFQNDQGPKKVFHLGDKPNESIGRRMKFFDDSMSQLFSDVYQERKKPEQLIHVTCSGYVSPSPAQKVFCNENQNTTVTHCYHMGCYASVPAIRMAQGFLFSSDRDLTCDVFHTELCSLHFQTDELSPEQLVIQSLFSDGTVVYKLTKQKPQQKCLELLYAGEKIIPNSSDHMAWSVSENGFSMTLSKDVPLAVADFLKEKLQKWTELWPEHEDLTKDAIWAIHPGGPKIIDGIKQSFDLSEEQIKHSRQVLYERGNMSSATLPHIWSEIVNDPSVAEGTKIISLAFGPGLTVAATLMKVTR